MNAFKALANRHSLHLIEDAAHAIETVYCGRKVGSIGDITCFSFYVTKSIVTGEGGMVTTENPEWASRLRTLSLHGLNHDAWKRFSSDGCPDYEVLEPGFKYNMMDVQAALGLHQLARVESNYQRRDWIWQLYSEAFRDLPVFPVFARTETKSRHALHLYTLILDLARLRHDRDFVRQALKEQGIGTGIHYKALHLHAYYRERFGFARGMFANAEWVSDRTLSLPLSPEMTEDDVARVIDAVRTVLLQIQH